MLIRAKESGIRLPSSFTKLHKLSSDKREKPGASITSKKVFISYIYFYLTCAITPWRIPVTWSFQKYSNIFIAANSYSQARLQVEAARKAEQRRRMEAIRKVHLSRNVIIPPPPASASQDSKYAQSRLFEQCGIMMFFIFHLLDITLTILFFRCSCFWQTSERISRSRWWDGEFVHTRWKPSWMWWS